MFKFLILAATFAVAYGGIGTPFKMIFGDCRPTFITFQTRLSCAYIDGAVHFQMLTSQEQSSTIHDDIQQSQKDMCELEICGDGQKVSGSYCGKGPCNFFGQNCKGGCIEGTSGDAVIRFKNRWPRGTVYNVS